MNEFSKQTSKEETQIDEQASQAASASEQTSSVLSVDQKIRAATRKGAGTSVLAGGAILIVLSVFFAWLFLVKGYMFVVSPAPAKASMQLAVVEGIGFVSDERVYIFGNQASIAVNADRYQTQRINLDADSPSIVDVTLIPSPATVTTQLNDVIGETAWFVDDVLVATGNNLSHSLAPGTYQLSVRNPYYVEWKISLNLERGQIFPVDVALEPVSGVLSISSVPLGALVVLEGEAVGKTPLTLDAIGGTYDISLSAEGYEVLSDNVQLLVDDTQPSRTYNLSPLQASVEFELMPNDGLLTVNGAQVDSKTIKLDANRTHNIRYSQIGFYPTSQQVSLSAGQLKRISLKLKQEVGLVTFSANMPADVFVDDKFLGTSPQTLKLQALPSKVTFKKAGYRTVTKTFTSSGQKATEVEATMLTEFDARRAEGRPLFVSTLGINMKRFSANEFVMGSAPNEAGRMRNEHQVMVDFSRDFWVAQHEVTEAQYAAFDSTRSGSSLPVTNVTWIQAAKYCNWLSAQEGLAPFYQITNDRLIGINTNNKGYRLLTEAEWEWLAKKARRSTPTKYVWGNVERIPKKSGNFADKSASSQMFTLDKYDDGFAGKAPVGSFKADRADLYDLAGNVSEWVNDFYTNTPPDTTHKKMDYMGAARGQQHVVKGANYQSGKMKELRASARIIGEGASETIGFRIARYN